MFGFTLHWEGVTFQSCVVSFEGFVSSFVLILFHLNLIRHTHVLHTHATSRPSEPPVRAARQSHPSEWYWGPLWQSLWRRHWQIEQPALPSNFSLSDCNFLTVPSASCARLSVWEWTVTIQGWCQRGHTESIAGKMNWQWGALRLRRIITRVTAGKPGQSDATVTFQSFVFLLHSVYLSLKIYRSVFSL